MSDKKTDFNDWIILDRFILRNFKLVIQPVCVKIRLMMDLSEPDCRAESKPPGIKLFPPVRRQRPAEGVQNHFRMAKARINTNPGEHYLFMSVFER